MDQALYVCFTLLKRTSYYHIKTSKLFPHLKLLPQEY
ncbi:Uncharacterised protein [Legionella wadsworthii]|uniref:Uncharacterized protein n=1 Tax=Legionella wadsworthii TaxID=28088 RepID=A0A378LUC0_9GAMM|nr:Uncharacterised protein [Legionella wadsworthii]